MSRKENAHFDYELVALKGALETGFIDSRKASEERYVPRFLTNNPSRAETLLSVIERQLRECDSFDFSIAFITAGGLCALFEVLNELKTRGIHGRLLTTTFNNFNTPSVFRKLLQYTNIETRVYQGDFHAKGYLFNKEDISTIIIGSSNLTQAALKANKEWNVLFHSHQGGRVLESTRAEFDALWNDSTTVCLSRSWIAHYEHYLEEMNAPVKALQLSSFSENATSFDKTADEITPNAMQEGALAELRKIHERKELRALLISATGTGKTYLAALDVRQTAPKRVLFVAHRESILSASLKSFQRVLGSRYSYEQFGAGCAHPTASCVFAMAQTLSRHLHEFNPTEFDYILIDEAHHVGATGYQQIINYFQPKFCMGMTATPNRTDGYDVFKLFNHCIAYRITLQDALENNLLVPFHYFGIADLEINDAVYDAEYFACLTSEERVRHITQKIEEYSIEKEQRRGLIFCSRNDEAARLSEAFNALGYKTLALSGNNTNEERHAAVARLEQGDLQYLLTVDIFNEGIDIPSLNQIIMLRRTESAIVFVQQLGRGLRKYPNKDYTLVLDFIGNYQKNFLVPIALSGDRSFNKDNLRRFVKEGSITIPGCSTINFDAISEKRVMRAIDGGSFTDARLLREEYENIRQELGHIPSLLDFDQHGAIDPLLFISKYGSYYAFLRRVEKSYQHELDQTQVALLKTVSLKMAHGKRAEELLLLRELIERGQSNYKQFACVAERATNRALSRQTLDSCLRVLSGSFAAAENLPLIKRADEAYYPSDLLANALKDAEFKRLLLETVDFGLSRYQSTFGAYYKDTNFSLYEKYTYEEVCKLLNWNKNINGQNIGGYKYDSDTNTFPVFINYDKAPDISDSTKYEDRFISEKELVAISKNRRSLTSPEITRLMASPKNGMRTFLFMRKDKNDADSKQFYFLGEMHPTQEYHEIVMPGNGARAVEIHYELEEPVRADLYDYLTSSLIE